MSKKITLEDAFQEGLAQGRKDVSDAIKYYIEYYLLKNGGDTLITNPKVITKYIGVK